MAVTAESIRAAQEKLDAPPLTDEQIEKAAILLSTGARKRERKTA